MLGLWVTDEDAYTKSVIAVTGVRVERFLGDYEVFLNFERISGDWPRRNIMYRPKLVKEPIVDFFEVREYAGVDNPISIWVDILQVRLICVKYGFVSVQFQRSSE